MLDLQGSFVTISTMWIIKFVVLHLAVNASTSFTDQDLNRLIKDLKGESALIYTWSPNMALSKQGLDELLSDRLLSSKRVVVLLDPNASQDLASKTVADHKWPKSTLIKNKSESLYRAGARVHYPSYFVIQDGSIKIFIPGYKSQTHLKRLLARAK